MTAATATPSVVSSEFARAHQVAWRMMRPELTQVQQQVSGAAAGLPGPGGVAARHLSARPGKMLRPMLVGLVHRAVGGNGSAHVALAAAVVETIHLSTLLHDDVVDNAVTRRGQPSANAVAGNTAAVLGGDAMVVRAMQSAHALGPQALDWALAAMAALVEGELIQLAARRRVDTTPAAALQVAALKTGALMRLCAQLGVLTAGGNMALAQCWGDAFCQLGVAFQVADDVLDLSGDPAVLGKAVGADLLAGTLSYPTALALADCPWHARALAAAFVRGGDAATVGRVVAHALQRSGALARALVHAQRALAPALELVWAAPPSRARTVLAAVCAGILRRTW